MTQDLNKKIEVLTQRAKEKANSEDSKKPTQEQHFPNSLAEHIKTPEQAKAFLTLLRSL